MINDHISQFPKRIQNEQGAAHPSGRSFEYSQDVLACVSLFPNSGTRPRVQRFEALHALEPLIKTLSAVYEIPPPTLAFLAPELLWKGKGCYDKELHEIRISPKISSACMVQVVFHECHHAYQASLIAAAVVRDVADGRVSPDALNRFFPSLVDSVVLHRKHDDPELVAIGRLFQDSRNVVSAAQRYGSITTDVDEYLMTQKVYRNSFEELCASVIECEVTVWQAEQKLRELEECTALRRELLAQFGWIGEVLFSVESRFLSWRGNALRTRIRRLSEEILHKCECIHQKLAGAG
ncbi:MAG: hypothetical protein RL518_2392 [Pseudomonadota bacterium]|jgi:hypothetical protein